MKLVRLAMVWVSVGAALVGFYQPWAMIDVHAPELVTQLKDASQLGGAVDQLTKGLKRVAVTIRRGAETVTGDLPSLSDIPKEVSGAQIPQMANNEKSHVAIALMELLTNTRQRIGLKSYAVYLLPGLALLCGILLTVLGSRRALVVALAVLCAAVAGGGFWKLLTTNTKTLFIAITIGRGLWMSLWAYAGLAVAAGLTGFAGRGSDSSRSTR